MPPRTTSPNASDHDLLIRIDTRLQSLSESVAMNHSAVTTRLNELDKDKASYKDLDVLRKAIEESQTKNKDDVGTVRTDYRDLADKVDWTRKMLWIAIGVVGVLQILIPFLLVRAFK